MSIIKDTCPSVKYIPLHKMIENMINLLINFQPVVHSSTGCDITSNIRKKVIAIKTALILGELLKDFEVALLGGKMIQNAEELVVMVGLLG